MNDPGEAAKHVETHSSKMELSLEQHGQTFQGQKLGGWTKRRHSTAVQQVCNTIKYGRYTRPQQRRQALLGWMLYATYAGVL